MSAAALLENWQNLVPQTALTQLETALDQSRDPKEQLLLRLATAECFFALGQFQASRDHGRLLLQNSENDPALTARVFHLLGKLEHVLGNFTGAMQHYNQGLQLTRQYGLHPQEIQHLHGQSLLYGDLANYPQAIGLALQILELETQTGSPATQLRAKISLGMLCVSGNELERGLEILLEALPQARALDHKRNLTDALLDLGFCYLNLGFAEKAYPNALENAKQHLSEALALSHQFDDAQGQVLCLCNLGEIANHERDFGLAKQYLLEAKTINQTVQDRSGAVRIQYLLGNVHMQSGEPEVGLGLIRAALEDAKTLGAPRIEAQVLEVLATALEQTSDLAGALAATKQVRKIEEQTLDETIRTRVLGLMIQHQTEQLRREAASEREQRNRLERENAQLAKLSTEDGLTGAYNRRYLETFLEHEVARATRQQMPLCLVMLDLDHFKQINDSLSHAFGDRVLKKVVELVWQCIRKADVLCRFGGEEFALVLPDTTLETGVLVCERIRLQIAEFAWASLHPSLHVTVSLGITQLQPAMNPEALVSAADAALYFAKNSGRNRVGTNSTVAASN